MSNPLSRLNLSGRERTLPLRGRRQFPTPLQKTAWTPASLGAKRVAHWDAKAASGTSRLAVSGFTVSSWTDEVAGIALTATGSAQPMISSGYCGGRPSVVFDGVDDCLRGTTGLSVLPNGSTPGEVWVLFESIGTPNNSNTLVEYGSITNGQKRNLRRTTTERLQASDGTAMLTSSGISTSTAGAHMAGANWATPTVGQIGARIAGIATTPPYAAEASLTTGTTRFAIGATNSTTAGNFARIAVSAVLVTLALTPDQRRKLESWGYREVQRLSILPNSHPYKNGPDSAYSFSNEPPGQVFFRGVSFLDTHIDFRSLDVFPNQISCSRASLTSDYNTAGVLQTFGNNVPAWPCADPVTHEAYGIQQTVTNSCYGVNRSAPAAQSISLPIAAGPYFSAYVFGTGSMRMVFSKPVTLVDALGNSTGTTSDLTVAAVDPNAVGYLAGAQLFAPSADVTVALSFSGTCSFFQVEADAVTPPLVGSNTRRSSILTAPYELTGLDPTISKMTATMLYRVTHSRIGGTVLQIDDNILPASPFNAGRRYTWNYLPNPNPSLPSKNGQQGITIQNTDNQPDAPGLDPTDVVVTANRWICFATSFDASTGVMRVCANGGIVRENTFSTSLYPKTKMSIMRLMLQAYGAPAPGYLGGLHFSQDLASDLSARTANGGLFSW